MGTTPCRPTHHPDCLYSLMPTLLIALMTEVIFFLHHKLWNKTSITRWANAISSQQPYHLQKQRVLPRGKECCSGLCVMNNEDFAKGNKEGGGKGVALYVMQPLVLSSHQCKLRVRERQKGEPRAINIGCYLIGFLTVLPLLSGLYLMNSP